jgi:hypothetical protein
MHACSNHLSCLSPISSIQLPFHGSRDIHNSAREMSNITVRPCISFSPYHPFDCRILVFLRGMVSRRDCERITVCERKLALQLAKINNMTPLRTMSRTIGRVLYPSRNEDPKSVPAQAIARQRSLTSGMISGER